MAELKLHELTAWEIHEKVASGEVLAREVVEDVFDRIGQAEENVKAFVTLTHDLALEQAEAVDREVAAGEPLPPLAGVPIAIKDNMCTPGVTTTCSSHILANFVPPYEATVVRLIREAGALCVGKTNMDEFAMGSSTENSGFFPTRNPWNLETVPGGSSGGSTAAVAAREATVALGSDTGGSIRQPASFCGVVGMKPTYGRVSRYGLIAFASSLDQIGPVARNVRDTALLMNVICGHDLRDSTSVNLPIPNYLEALTRGVKGLRLGVPKELFVQGVTKEVAGAVRAALDHLQNLGAECDEISMPAVEYALPTYYIIAPAEASSNLARYDGVQYGHRTETEADIIEMLQKTRREGFGHEVQHRIMIGTYALSSGYYDAYYLKALKVRTLIRQDFDRAFKRFDALVSPTSPTVAFRLGEKTDPLEMKLSDVLTVPVNMAGLPGISVPCGFHDGLPIGLQIIGKPLDEMTVLQLAYAYEQTTEWHKRKAEVGEVRQTT